MKLPTWRGKLPQWNGKKTSKDAWKASLRTRSFRVGGYSVAAAAIVVVIAVVANLLVNALPAGATQFDISAGSMFTMSQETEQLLDGLDQDITVYWLVQSGQEDETLGTLLDRYTSRSDRVTLEKRDPDQVTSLTWQYEEETISLEKDQENNWTYPADAAFPLDQSYPDAMVQALKEIQAAKTIENVEDLSEYGLENAVCSITVQGEKEYQLAIGEETGLGGQRYLSIGDGNVYLVDASLLDTFALGLYDIVEKETIPSMTDLRGVQITTNAGTLEMEYQEDSGLAYSDQYTWFWKTDGGYTALDTDLAESLVQNITGLTWNSCVEYQASADDLGRYGLDKPAATVTVRYTETSQVETNETDENGEPVYETQQTDKTFVLELGDYDGDTCYARLGGSSMVYQVDGTLCDAILAANGTDLLPQDVILLDWSQVTGVEIQLDGEAYTLEKTVQETTDEDGATTETYVYQRDGKTVEITDALDRLQELEPTGSDANAAGNKTEIVFTFQQDNASYPAVELAFYQYDSSSCLVGLNGETRLLVDRDSVLEIVDTVRELLTE